MRHRLRAGRHIHLAERRRLAHSGFGYEPCGFAQLVLADSFFKLHSPLLHHSV